MVTLRIPTKEGLERRLPHEDVRIAESAHQKRVCLIPFRVA